MSNEKPVELTEAECALLDDWWVEAERLTVESVTPFVARIVKAREAAARREALLEAKRTMCAECASRVDEQEER